MGGIVSIWKCPEHIGDNSRLDGNIRIRCKVSATINQINTKSLSVGLNSREQNSLPYIWTEYAREKWHSRGVPDDRTVQNGFWEETSVEWTGKRARKVTLPYIKKTAQVNARLHRPKESELLTVHPWLTGTYYQNQRSNTKPTERKNGTHKFKYMKCGKWCASRTGKRLSTWAHEN